MARTFCKHYRAMAYHKTCNVGVVYGDLQHAGTKEFHDACPCFGPQNNGECASKLYPTLKEMEAEDKQIAEMFVHMATARLAIVDSLGGPWKRGMPGSAGSVDCPKCNGEKTLRFTRSGYNGHIHASCTTEKCLGWME